MTRTHKQYTPSIRTLFKLRSTDPAAHMTSRLTQYFRSTRTLVRSRSTSTASRMTISSSLNLRSIFTRTQSTRSSHTLVKLRLTCATPLLARSGATFRLLVLRLQLVRITPSILCVRWTFTTPRLTSALTKHNRSIRALVNLHSSCAAPRLPPTRSHYISSTRTTLTPHSTRKSLPIRSYVLFVV